MKYFIATVSLSSFLFILLLRTAEALIRSEVSHPAVWKIANQNHCKKNGTAFAISPNQFITNFHVIKSLLDKVILDIDSVRITQSDMECFFPLLSSEPTIEDLILSQEGEDKEIHIKKLLLVSAVYDLVLFETKENVEDHLSTAESLDLTEDLSIYGYPIAFKGDLRHIKKTGPVIHEGSYFYSFPVNHSHPKGLGGVSGSPILNTEEQVVGVAFLGGTNTITITKLKTLQNFVLGKEGISCFGKTMSECLEEAQEEIENSSEDGNAEAQYQLAAVHYRQICDNPEKSFEWYKKSAEQGNNEAQYAVGTIYLYGPEEIFKSHIVSYEGKKIVKDHAKAIDWYKKSAEQGYAIAQYELGKYYKKIEDYTEAVYWLRKSDEQGHPIAPYFLAIMYEKGYIVEENFENKFDLLKKSANRGKAEAQYHLGKMYYEGKEIDKNCKEAVYWLKESTKQACVEAQHAVKQLEKIENCTVDINWLKKPIGQDCVYADR